VLWRDTVCEEQKKKGRERETHRKVRHNTTANVSEPDATEMKE